MIRELVTLYFREGSSDKVYGVVLEEKDGGWAVNFAFGRRGSTLQTGTKTPVPLPYQEAKRVYDKLVQEKKAKGYTQGADGTPYAGTEKEARDSGLRPQLLNPITEEEAERYLSNSGFWLQEKVDGKRVLLKKAGGTVVGINRKGLVIALPRPIVEHAHALKGEFVLDGEAVGDRFVAFDCLRIGTTRLEAHPYRDRWKALLKLAGETSGVISTVQTAAAGSKRGLLKFLREAKAEGAVFKNHTAPYTPGRPASGGPQVKLKFYATASCLVAHSRNGRRSVGLEVLDGVRRVQVGNVTIPPNAPIPMLGDVVEVRYLYAFLGGSLFQPVYLGRRDDLAVEACTSRQLKFKRQDGEDEA